MEMTVLEIWNAAKTPEAKAELIEHIRQASQQWHDAAAHANLALVAHYTRRGDSEMVAHFASEAKFYEMPIPTFHPPA